MAVSAPKGTRDLLPVEMNQRLALIDTLRGVFTRYGFEPLETPAFERIDTLLGKYGDEGEKLIFKILKRGHGAETGQCDLALRYDLTVPLARVLASHSDLPLPFKRYQIQPVWRAERPQRGRFREFYQCDVDTVGCEAMTADAECIAIVHDAMEALGVPTYTIRFNHRQVLRGIVEAAGQGEREIPVLVAVDKLDKIGWEGVGAELAERGVDEAGVARIRELLAVDGDEALDLLERELGEGGRRGVAELREMMRYVADMGVDLARVRFDPTLARGLGYYTGPVFETVTEPYVGSVSGGGRYDGLIGMFSKRELPAVGVSLGLDRLLLLLGELGRLDERASTTEAFVTVFNEALRGRSLEVATALRAAGVGTQVSMDLDQKLGKQFKHADRVGARWAVVIGPDDVSEGLVALKDLRSGDQVRLPLAEAVARVAAG
ncbi:MAG: histidine--tRNA ligase [Alphaproteobacteria bacterium]|nr:histidine--tRNA ligase [Alphaproteobacteria bacterium]